MTDAVTEPATTAAQTDWTRSLVYRDLVAHPEIRRLIEEAAARAKPGMTGEELLRKADGFMKLATGGVPVSVIGEIAKPLSEKMGFKTGKTASRRFALAPGRTIVATLCSMAQRGQVLKAARQAADGLALEATLPSDMWAFEGKLLVTFRADGEGTLVEAVTQVPGQMFDWGKSDRAFKALFEEIEGLATLQP